MTRFRNSRTVMLLLVDAVLINFSYILALYLGYAYNIPPEQIKNYAVIAGPTTFIYFVCFSFFKLYESLWCYAGTDEFLFSAGGCITGTLLTIICGLIIGSDLPHNINFLAGIFTLVFVLGFRMSIRIYRRLVIRLNAVDSINLRRVLVVGAGDAGAIVINEMKKHSHVKYVPVGLIDDNRRKIGTSISGVKVLGDRTIIKNVVKNINVDEIFISIPSLKGDSKRELIQICRETNCKVKVLPGVYELINGEVTLQKLREVEVGDLLGREAIVLDSDGIMGYIKDKTILVTGGGGSIGSELCRQILNFSPRELLILDCYENNAYDLYNELKFKCKALNVKVIIASVRDRERMEKIFEEYKPEVVFHAAAHKHVPLMEDNPTEAIKNNVFGTLNAAECADKFGAKRFVLISTDKAVNPTNIMGVSKRICEMIIQAMNKQSDTEFVAVRFGNVLGSNGSVIPLFKKQIYNGGPVTVTHKAVTRYFMTITEAAQLVLQAGAFAEGGEIFVLDMGSPVKIYDLACDLIRLSGLEPNKDIKIEITGLRPGEKLFEELLTAEEGLNSTKHDKIFVVRPIFSDIEILRRNCNEMRLIIQKGNREELIRKLEELVPTYRRERQSDLG